MLEIIESKPKIPEVLRLAALQRKLIPFIGAGVSQIGGALGWKEFADAALNFFVEQGKMSHAQFDQISSLSARVKLTLALDLENRHNLIIDFNKLLSSSTSEKKKKGDDVYSNLSKLSTTFVTTNYDDWLDKSPPKAFRADEQLSTSEPSDVPRHPFFRRSDISVVNLDVQNAVFHIHGSILERESMVLTTLHYLDRYSSHRIDGEGNHENPYLTFLQTLFRLKNVLFIGYGLEELEILEYVVQKGMQKLPNNIEEPRHYVLQGFFSHELELARSLESYFSQFGIGLLPFSRDERNWDQLVEVIEYLSREIPPGRPLTLPKRREMEELLL